MNPWDVACIVRFQAFPFIEDRLKRQPIRFLFEMDVQHPGFQRVLQQTFQQNQFVRFRTFMKHLHRNKPPNIYVPLASNTDIELIEALFWEETSEPMARRILSTLLRFPTDIYPSIWTSGTNLLLRAQSADDKECALMYMDVWAAVAVA